MTTAGNRRRLSRLLVAGVVVVAAALAALAIGVRLLLDPETYRPIVIAAVAEQTGYQLALPEPLSISAFPCCAITTGQVTVSAQGVATRTADTASGPFASLSAASISFDPWALLWRREIVLGTLTVDGLVLDLVAARDGRNNWMPEKPVGSPERSASAAPVAAADSKPATPTTLQLAGIEIRAARIGYRDSVAQTERQLHDIDLQTGAIGLNGGQLSVASTTISGVIDDWPRGQPATPVRLSIDQVALDTRTGSLSPMSFLLHLAEGPVNGKIARAADGLLTVDLSTDSLDLNRYLATTPEDDRAPEAVDEEPPLPVAALRALRIDGNLRIGTLVWQDERLQSVAAKLTARSGKLSIDPLTATLGTGNLAGQFMLDVSGQTPKLTAKQDVEQLDITDRFADPSGQPTLTGRIDAHFQSTGRGDTLSALLNSQTGAVDLTIHDARYEGVDLVYEIRRATALVRREPMPSAPREPATPIDELALHGSISGEQITVDRITARAPNLAITGRGTILLGDQTIDLRMQAELLSPPREADAKDANEANLDRNLRKLVGKPIPFTISGTIADPAVAIDLGRLLESQAQDLLQQGLKKLFGGGSDNDN